MDNSVNKIKDHRILSAEMDLFSFHDESPGFPFYKENFLIIRDALLDFLKSRQQQQGYYFIETPLILRNDLWVASGHWDNYSENMYWMKSDNQIEVIKPMNCPGGVLVFKEKIHSYRELPIKIAELGSVVRRELSGNVNGLFRTRGFLMDDAHVYMMKEQIKLVLHEIIDLIEYIYNLLGFEYIVSLSTRPAKSIGSDENWGVAIEALKQVLEERKKPYNIKEGDGAFYGPKIDFDIQDSLGRNWQCGTIQLDFNLPERFDLRYQNSDGNYERIIMIHRAILGGVERFIAILLEHLQGKLPLWLSPQQIRIVNINDDNLEYAWKIQKKLKDYRVSLDNRQMSLQKKIREAILEKVNYIVIIGSKEVRSGNISVRRRDKKQFNNISINSFKKLLRNEIKNKLLAEY